MDRDNSTDRINILGMLWLATLTIGGTFVLLGWTLNSPQFTAIIALVGPLCGGVVGHYFAMRQAAQGGRTAINAAQQSVTTVRTPDLGADHPSTEVTTRTGPQFSPTNPPADRPAQQ